MFEDKNILITGGTGSLGQALTKRLLEYDVKTLRIFSRNEKLQVDMKTNFDDPRLRFLIGDIRDEHRLSRATEDIDIVFHAAALKHVPLIEHNPSEAILTNVDGSNNLLNSCVKNNVEKVVGISTDKAVSPLNTYGATKLLMEKLFVSAINEYSSKKYKTRFVITRYGNVVASSGSVIPTFIEQIKNKQKITITDPEMTRFSLTMNEVMDFILSSAEKSIGSEVFIPKMKAYNIMDLKDALLELIDNPGYEIINVRVGEKLHESLISKYEIPYTKDLGDRFAILFPQIFNERSEYSKEIYKKYENEKSLDSDNEYSSECAELMSKDELKIMLSQYI